MVWAALPRQRHTPLNCRDSGLAFLRPCRVSALTISTLVLSVQALRAISRLMAFRAVHTLLVVDTRGSYVTILLTIQFNSIQFKIL
jgi:hypothetical protein